MSSLDTIWALLAPLGSVLVGVAVFLCNLVTIRKLSAELRLLQRWLEQEERLIRPATTQEIHEFLGSARQREDLQDHSER